MNKNQHQNSPNLPPIIPETNEDIKQLFDLLAQGEAKLNSEAKIENATLILGNTGSGKSTLTRRIAGYDTQMISVEEGLDFSINKLDNSTHTSYVTSATIFPELVVDNSTGAGYYDFPGFLDTRGMAYDVLTSYFIKKVIDKVERVKILLLTNYTSLTVEGTRDDFTNLLKHVTAFVRNIDHFKDSIALIVSKVRYPEIPDGQLIQNIVKSIKKVKQELQKQMDEKQADNFSQIKLINTLLLKVKGTYPKIGISRSPNQTGLLSEISLLQENKQKIKAMIENLSFVQTISSEFDNFIPKKSLHDVGKVIDEINTRIRENIEKSGEEMQNYFISKEDQIYDIFKLCNETSMVNSRLVALKQIASSHEKPEDCAKELINGVAFTNSDSIKQSLQTAMQYGHYSSFLHDVSNYKTRDSLKCTKGLNNVLEYSHRSKKLYEFLADLYSKLQEYEVQKNTRNSLCIDLANNLAAGEFNSENSASLLPFLKKCFQTFNHDINDIIDIPLDKPKLKTLHRILDTALKHDLDYSCDSDKLVVKGNYIKLDDIFKSNCTSPQIIEIFALNKIFVNSDFSMRGDGVQLFIIAPTWEILGEQKIILDGTPGEAHDSSKAQNGIIPEENGRDGKPGSPGKFGGHFVGIGENLINLEQLTISVNGGEGGPGQDGGDGANGRNGDDAYDDVDETKWGCLLNLIPTPCACNSTSKSHNITVHISEGGDRNYFLAGKAGSKGGNGGDGGKGGVGGYPGDVIYTSLSPKNTTEVQVVNRTGHNGLDGKGGKGGLGGKFGRNLEIWSPCHLLPSSHRIYKMMDSGTQASMGNSGTNGGNSAQMKLSQQKELFPYSYTISNYKKYVREHLHHSIQESYLSKFLHDLENNDYIQNHFHKTRGLLDDFKNLENQYYQSIGTTSRSILPDYQSLLNRVEVFTSNNVNKTQFKDHKVLHYLSMAILSRICNIKHDLENYQVVDIDGYFPLLEKHIEEYKSQLKEIQINTLKKHYENTINVQISEANNLIEKSILPEIDQIRKQLDHQIHLLTFDIIEQEKKAETKKKELIEKQKELATHLPLKAVTNMLDYASAYLIFLGPRRALTATAQQSTIKANQHPLSFDESEASMLTDRTTNHMLRAIHERKQQLLKEVLESEDVDNVSTLDNEDSEEISGDENPLESLISVQHETIKERLNEYNHKFLKKKTALENNRNYKSESQKRQKVQKIESKLNWVKHMQSTVIVAEAIADSNIKLQNSNEVISALGDSIQLVEDNINKLRDYERDLKDIFIPWISITEEKSSEMLQNASNRSHVGLEIDKSRMQKFFKNFQVEMKNIVEISGNAAIKNKLKQCVDNLFDAMMTALQIFDRIQDHQDRVKFAKYIADLNSREIMSDYSEFSQNVDELELTIKSNLVLQEYEKALGTFKQYIFPFANKYLNQFDVSAFLRPINLTDVITKAVKEINVLKEILIKEDTSVTDSNDTVFSNIRYDMTNFDQKPFFIWKYDTYGEEIHKLLQGQEIMLKADARLGILQNAVKFKEIGIRFVLSNETIQNNFDQETVNFLVKLTHFGNSHYRCNYKYYIFHHNILSMVHSVNTANDTLYHPHYHHMDKTSELIKANKSLFSPYATWSMQLKSRFDEQQKMQHKNSSIFDGFKKFFNETMDLVLEGYGGHVSFPASACDNNVEKYYTPYDTISKPYLHNSNQQISKGRRKREHVTNSSKYPYSNDINFARNSANTVKSPVYTAIHFISGILGHFKSFHIPNSINYNSIKEGVQSLFGGLKTFNIYATKDYSQYTGNFATFNVHESLTLVDFFVRWVTKMKPYDNMIDESVNFCQVTASVLNIITKMEKISNDLSIQYNLSTESLEFDPIVLISALEKEVLSGNCQKMKDIVFRTIMDNFHHSTDDAQFLKHVAQTINEVLGIEN